MIEKAKPVEKPQIPKSNLPPPSMSKIPQAPIYQQSNTQSYDQFALKGDVSTGPIIEEFQINYYEQTGGSNFMLMEEMHPSFDSKQFASIEKFVKSLNEFKEEGLQQTQAKKKLQRKLTYLVKSLYDIDTEE